MSSQEKDSKEKEENDKRIMNMFENLNRGMNDDTKKILMNQLVSKQQENNEKLINDQKKMIDTLNSKCKRLENDIKKLNVNQAGKFL